MSIQIAPGVFDILPLSSSEDWRASHLWQYVEAVIRKTAREYGYQEMRTPLFERTELFQRSVGEDTDIVSKEMYTFLDKGNRSMSLRPEGTAPAMRSIIENNLSQTCPHEKFFYIGPMFRYERSQAGRYRQHNQFGAEAIGNGSPEQDVELIDLLYTLYQRLGLKHLQVYINSIGDSTSRLTFKEKLKEYFSNHYNSLSEDSKVRLEKNPLRILDSKDPGDIKINANAPSILDDLSPESKEHFETVKRLLLQLNIPFIVNPMLVRGLDYYNKTVFEVTAGELGAQNSVAGGGRYDGLLKSLGGPDIPSAGFGTGIERVIQTMIKQQVALPSPHAPDVSLIAMGQEAKTLSFSLLHDLRCQGISTHMDFGSKKLGKAMQQANQLHAKYAVVIGDEEIATQTVQLKNMDTGETRLVQLSDLGAAIKAQSAAPCKGALHV